MAIFTLATFNIPCSGAGTFTVLSETRYSSIATIGRRALAVTVDDAGNQISYQDETSVTTKINFVISVVDGMATVKLTTGDGRAWTSSYRCCFIPGDPFSDNNQ